MITDTREEEGVNVFMPGSDETFWIRNKLPAIIGEQVAVNFVAL